jgi:hypothetical protein
MDTVTAAVADMEGWAVTRGQKVIVGCLLAAIAAMGVGLLIGPEASAPAATRPTLPPVAADDNKVDQADTPSPPSTEIPEYAQEPPRPSVTITCPPDGYGNKVTFGGGWEVATPEATMRINYGDGRTYKTSRFAHFKSAYWHTYQTPGTFVVKIVLTDSAGQSDSDSCTVRVLPEPTYVPPYDPPSYPGRLPGGGIDHDWPTNPGPGSPSRPIQPYPAPPGDPNDRDGDGVACEYGCQN